MENVDKQTARIRIKDIAQMAEVSVGTVDRVLHGRTGVSEASRKKVENILKQLDYQPNMYASALASNKKYVFACLLPMHAEGDYWVDVEKVCNRPQRLSPISISPCILIITTSMNSVHSYQLATGCSPWNRTEWSSLLLSKRKQNRL